MTALTASDREHLARLLGLLGSDFAGERDAAGLAAMRFIKQHNTTWFHILGVADQPEPIRVGWCDLVRECRAMPGCLRPWEAGFLRDLEGFPHLSVKQRNILYGIADRLGLRRTAA